ncbi:hypothetical protein ARMGADRAFT_1022666 [Armillaria gallica]|uniref:Uncharacterized protein n=1 Tax=Armillaria gallica TaxID=47427 RepID=A0A2H3E9V4_ARMGA|nr:hypothetical protein ARMGADRAFT_1022666 [Armillaria gallica]
MGSAYIDMDPEEVDLYRTVVLKAFGVIPKVVPLLSKMEALKYVDILCGERWEDDDYASNLPLVSCVTLWDYGVLSLILETWNELVLPELQHFDWYTKRRFYV